METKSIATVPSNSLPPSYRGIETFSAQDAGCLIVVSFVVITAIAASIYAFLPKQMQSHALSLKPPLKTPCQHCRYFSHNPYLKCTVHPCTVLTEYALDCPDYRPTNQLQQEK